MSLRIVNWIKWNMGGQPLSKKAHHSLAIQTRYLSKRLEYHLLGNHLLGKCKSPDFSGLFLMGKKPTIG